MREHGPPRLKQTRFLWAGALILLTIACGRGDDGKSGDRASNSGPIPVTAVPPGQLTVAPLVERAAPAVVSIGVLQASPTQENPLLRDPYFRRYFGVPDEALRPRLAAGSGVIVDSGRGLVLTNHHVVDKAQAIEVALPDCGRGAALSSESRRLSVPKKHGPIRRPARMLQVPVRYVARGATS